MNAKTYMWIGVILTLIGSIVFSVLSSGVANDIRALEENHERLLAEKEKVETRLKSTQKKFDKEKYKEEIETKTVNAIEVGEEIIEIQNKLADLFRIDGNPPKEIIEQRRDVAPKLGEKQAEISDIDPSFFYDTWKLNKDWDLKLETVISYENVSRFPVIFSMTTTKGEPAGMVKAIYDVGSNKFIEIERHYTAMGEEERVQGVGD